MGRITRQDITPEIAREYAKLYLSKMFYPQEFFVENFLDNFSNAKNILDLGCGFGSVDIDIVAEGKDYTIRALDSSPEMIELAKQRMNKFSETARINLSDNLFFYNSKMEDFPIVGNKFDAIISKDFIHFLKDPTKLWRIIQNSAKDGTVLYHMDWIRPETEEKAKEIVHELLGEHASYNLREDLYSSLRASLTPEEVKSQLHDYFPFSRSSLEVNVVDKGRHMLIKGIYHKSPLNNPQHRASHTKSRKH